MRVFFRELRAYRNSTIIWAVALSLLVMMFLSTFPSFSSDVEVAKKILENLPPFVRNAVGLSEQSFFTIYGFLSYLFTFVMLAGAVQAMNLGVGILSKEESGKTADFLLTKPISRTNIITSKLAAILTVLIITNVIFCSVAFMTALAVTNNDLRVDTFLLISLKLFLVQVIFASLGFLASLLLKKVKSPIAVSLPTVFGFFITGTIGAILGIDEVKYISPFKFYDSDYIIAHNAYDMKFLLIELAVLVVAVGVSYAIYLRKDIKAAA